MIKYKKIKGGYELLEDYQIRLTHLPIEVHHRYFNIVGGLLTIRAGYRWNGLNYTYTPAYAVRGSLIHDCLYQMIQLEILDKWWRIQADDLLYEAMLEDGGWWSRWYSWIVYKAVTKFGKYWI